MKTICDALGLPKGPPTVLSLDTLRQQLALLCVEIDVELASADDAFRQRYHRALEADEPVRVLSPETRRLADLRRQRRACDEALEVVRLRTGAP